MRMWRAPDMAEVREDMAHIAAMGFESVRLFALTEDFLPAPMRADPAMIGRLVDVVRAVADAGLKAVPTLVVINMSGWMWWPAWMLDGHGVPRDLFSDPELLRSQALLVEACAAALVGGAGLRALDLANEIDGARVPGSRHAGWLWAALLAGSARRAAPGVPVQIGAHLPSLDSSNNMRVDDLARVADEDVMHAYPLYSAAARTPLDPELVPFACALTADLVDTGRPVLMQEFGLPTAPPGEAGRTITDDFLGQSRPQYLASEEEAGAYHEAVLEGLVQTGAAGAYAWCYGDYDPRLFDQPPFERAVRERTFGLVRADGTEKPAAQAFRSLRRRRDRGDLLGGTTPRTLDIPADEYYSDPSRHFPRLYRRWLAARGHPA
jgi:endo-1,4-beta-mannosidase